MLSFYTTTELHGSSASATSRVNDKSLNCHRNCSAARGNPSAIRSLSFESNAFETPLERGRELRVNGRCWGASRGAGAGSSSSSSACFPLLRPSRAILPCLHAGRSTGLPPRAKSIPTRFFLHILLLVGRCLDSVEETTSPRGATGVFSMRLCMLV